jgi:hypothetical protein
MAKTKFTEARLEAITRKLEFEMWAILQAMVNNQCEFEAGKRPAREARMRHRKNVELFLRHNRDYLRAVRAANRIDRCEQDEKRHYCSKDSCDVLCKFYTLCEYFGE